MLPRGQRLSRALFPTLLRSRTFANSPHFTLRVAKDLDSKPRIAVSISKKVAKSAVIRNSTRRRVYAALRGQDARPGLYLFVAKSGAEELKGEALSREIGELLNRVF